MARKDTLLRRMGRALIGTIGASLIRALGATWRVHETGASPFDSGRHPLLGALWHHGVFCAAYQFRDRKAVVMVSRSRDGDWIEALLAGLGFAPSPRGSSSRGGAFALRRQIRQARETGAAALLPDGPRGPAGVAKPGVLLLARACEAPLWPIAFAATPALRFGSWDRTLLPLPFARVACVYGMPLEIPREADAARLEELRRELEATLGRLTVEANRSLGLEAPRPGGAR